MDNVKEIMTKIIQEQPDDTSYEEIVREKDDMRKPYNH